MKTFTFYLYSADHVEQVGYEQTLKASSEKEAWLKLDIKHLQKGEYYYL